MKRLLQLLLDLRIFGRRILLLDIDDNNLVAHVGVQYQKNFENYKSTNLIRLNSVLVIKDSEQITTN